MWSTTKISYQLTFKMQVQVTINNDHFCYFTADFNQTFIKMMILELITKASLLTLKVQVQVTFRRVISQLLSNRFEPKVSSRMMTPIPNCHVYICAGLNFFTPDNCLLTQMHPTNQLTIWLKADRLNLVSTCIGLPMKKL